MANTTNTTTTQTTPGAFINHINVKSIYEQKSAQGHDFVNCSIPSDLGITGFATIALNKSQVLNATTRNGEVLADYRNLYIGAADKTHKVTYCVKAATKKKAAEYATVTMSNADIAAMAKRARAAYRAQLKATATDGE